MICAYRLLSEDVELSLSTRESASYRDRILPFGITVISAGSKTTPGGYTAPSHELEQWEINDARTAAQVEAAVRAKGFDPVWKDWSMFMQQEMITPQRFPRHPRLTNSLKAERTAPIRPATFGLFLTIWYDSAVWDTPSVACPAL